jgi:hypothetical protein
VQVGDRFSLTLEVKARVPTGMILTVVSPTTGDYLTLELADGGRLVYTVENGAGQERMVGAPLRHEHLLCDGRWHTLKASYSCVCCVSICVHRSTKRRM